MEKNLLQLLLNLGQIVESISRLLSYYLKFLKGIAESTSLQPNLSLPENSRPAHVLFRHGERIGFSYLVSQKYIGEKAIIKVLRNSMVRELNIKLATFKRLVPAHIKGRPPSYYIVAGFVFTAISIPCLRSEYGKAYEYDAPVKLLEKYLHAMVQSSDDQLVVVFPSFLSNFNRYLQLTLTLVTKIMLILRLVTDSSLKVY